MFLGMAWYWWIVIALLLGLSLPLKVKFLKWWSGKNKERNISEKENGREDE